MALATKRHALPVTQQRGLPRFPNRPAAPHPLPVEGLTGARGVLSLTASAAPSPAASVVGGFFEVVA